MSMSKVRDSGSAKSASGLNLLTLLAALLLVMCSVTPAAIAGEADQWAAKPDSSASGPLVVHPVGYGSIFKLTTVTTPGVCSSGYAHQCASGTCECLTLTGKGSGSRFGVASAVSGEMTLDLGNQPGDPDGVCFPTFGFLEFVGTKDTEILDFTGASCEGFDAGTTTFNGGWEFAAPGISTFDAVGQAKGTFGLDTLKLTMNGRALP